MTALQSGQAPPIDGSDTVLAMFDAAVRRSPQTPALRHAGRVLRYGELDAAVNVRTAALLRRGLAPATPVAIVMATGIDYLVAMLAVLRAGGACMPLSPALPPARIERMLALAACPLALVDAAGAETCPPATTFAKVAFDELGAGPDTTCVLPAPPLPDRTAAIVFTSGSSGDPKGVRILHGNLAYYARWSSGFFGATVASRVPLTAAPHYAAAISQVFACLCAGGTLHILDDALGRPQRLLDFFAGHPGHALHCVPTVWRSLLDRLQRCSGIGKPAALFLSGEALSQALVDRTFAFDPELPVWNLYGPTESVANVSAKRLIPGEPVGIGRPLPGSRLFVVDDAGCELGEGMEGRLLIAGPGICPGYVGDEPRNRTHFFDFAAADGGTVAVYDTGDLARRRGDDIELLGRRDQQIKLRGVRIELGDVENNLLRHPDVAQAAVLLADDPEPALVAFVQPASGCTPDEDGLRRHLARLLPASMLPERWSLQSLPLLANGKIDRATLRSQLADIAVPAPASVAPEGDDERAMATLFDSVLGTRGTGRHDDFFALGGHSLKVYALLAAIEETWGAQLSFGGVYREPTVAALARRVAAAPRALPERGHEPLPRLSLAQRGLWLQQQARPESRAYHLCYRIELDADVSEARLRACVAQLCARHPILTCGIHMQDGEPVFRRRTDAADAFTMLDLGALPADGCAAALDAALTVFTRAPLGSDGGLLQRWQLIRAGTARPVLAFVVHHLVFDGVSASLLLRDLFDLLAGRDLPQPRGDGFEFAAREVRYLESPQHERDRAFWSRRLEGLAAQPAFPVAYKRADEACADGSRLRRRLPAATRKRLAAIARREGCSLHVLMLTVFGALLDRHEPGAEFLVAVPFSNRLRADEHAAIGYFTALLFYRLQRQPGEPLRALAARLRHDTIDLLDHQRLPFPELAAILREHLRILPPDTFRLMFGYHDTASWRAGDGSAMRAEEHFSGEVKCDLHLECMDDGDTLELAFSHRHAALDAAAAAEWLENFVGVLEDLESFLDRDRDEWPPMTDAEVARVLRHCRGANVQGALAQTVPQLFAAAAHRHPRRPAIWHDGNEIDYAELRARVTALAARLRVDPAAAAGPIGICMPHQPALLVALLACAECGFPYVPVDPAFPQQRIAAILEHAGSRLVLADAAGATVEFPVGIAALDVTRVDAAAGVGDATCLATPDSLLYVIYTSGSTGTPKGVMVAQRGVVNYLLWMQRQFEAGPDMRVLARTSIGFDISTWELLLPLISGGCVVLGRREDTESPENLARLAVAGRANVLQFVPSGLGLFVDAGMLPQVPGVRKLFCGGEALSASLEARVSATGYDGELHNLYGPTEASIFMSWHACDPAMPYAAVPIGRPIQNSALYVLDEQLRLLPPNVAGDLYIGGEVLAQGYWRDESRTREVFIDAPPGLPETRLYRTGDKGRMLSDGRFDYLGRDDQQVKIRGYRVELREIEHHLLAHAAVREAVAYTRQWGENDLRLHAAVVLREDAAAEVGRLPGWLKSRLPAWMVPATLRHLPALPRLANGKMDYHRLRDLAAAEPAQHVAAPAAPASDGIERAVAAIWQDVLGHAGFGMRDSFFDAGGHSILLLRMRELLRERLATDFTIAELYKAPNVAELARVYRVKVGAAAAAPLVAQIRERVARRRSRLSHQGEEP